jgi:hypothetical protein
MLVKSILVPLVDACEVPEVITLAPITGVPLIVGLVIVGVVSIGVSNVWLVLDPLVCATELITEVMKKLIVVTVSPDVAPLVNTTVVPVAV